MTPVEARTLEALSAYRFLTVEQMQRLGVGADRKHLGERLRALANRGLIGVLSWGVYPGLGRLPRMYHLKAKGAATLAAFLRVDVSEVPFVAGTPKFEMDHLHRRATVDCHIALTQWAAGAGRLVTGFRPYYGGQAIRLRLAGGRTLYPDAVFDLARPDGSPVLTAFRGLPRSRRHRSGADRPAIGSAPRGDGNRRLVGSGQGAARQPGCCRCSRLRPAVTLCGTGCGRKARSRPLPGCSCSASSMTRGQASAGAGQT